MTDLAANGTVSTQFNAAAAAPTGPSIAQMLQQLGYDPGRNGDKLAQAQAGFATDHHGENSDDKIRAMYEAAEAMQKKLKKEAPGISLAQTHAVMVASDATHVPADAFAKLAQSQRVFDHSFTTRQGRKPGLVQMSDSAWIDAVRQHGSEFPRTKDLAAQLNEPGPNGKPRTLDQLPQDLKNDVLELRSNNVISAEIGAEYAKRNPVQLDTMHAWLNTTGRNAADANRLDSLFAGAGIRNFDPRKTHTVTATDSRGRTTSHVHESDPWCAAMANSVLAGAGIPQSNGGSPEYSGDFMDWGTKVDPHKGGKVKPGDIVMFEDQDGQVHHVAFVKQVNANGTFTWTGGNQGDTGPQTLGQVTENDQTLPVTNRHVLFREPPPNAFARAETAYQNQLRQQSAPPKPNS